MVTDKITRLYVHGQILSDSFHKRRLRKRQRGVTSVEYALVAVAIAAVVSTAFTGDGASTLSGALKESFQKIANQIRGQ